MSTQVQIIIRSCDRRVLEIEQIKAWLVGNGFNLLANHWNVDPDADIVILTTCGVTQSHEDFTFEMLNSIIEKKKPSAMVVMGGCVPEINPERVAEEFDGPTFSPKSYYKLDDILKLPRRLNEFDRPHTHNTHSLYRTDVGNIISYARSFSGHIFDLKYNTRRIFRTLESRIGHRSTYIIQIHEGCSMGCTYCAIRKAIGPLRNSKLVEAIIEEVHQGIESGYQRIRLIGDSAGSYGLDIGTNLGVLLNQISQIKDAYALQLTDINPVFLPVIFEPVKELCIQKRLSSLYIPLQSGNKRILSLMNRHSDIAKTRQMLNEIKQSGVRGFKLGTSVIVGFPSETIDEFRDTINICNEVNFDWIWCHGFSARPGTPAWGFPGQLSADDVFERVNLFRKNIKRKGTVILDSP